MIKNLSILIFTFIFIHFSFSQKLEVTYYKAYKNYKDFSDSEPKILKNSEYQLKINGNKAIFEKVKKMDNDFSINKIYRRGGGNGIYFKDLTKKEKFHKLKMATTNDEYIVSLPFNEYKWNLTKETKEINGFKCYKALTKYSYFSETSKKNITINIIVWYTPEIPYPFGPSGKDGLPGLVLETHINSFYFIATKINFKPNGSFVISKPKKGIEVSKKEYTLILNQKFNKLKEYWINN